MKVIYLHQYFNTPEMSGGTRSFEFGKRMAAAGHEVHVITSSRAPHIENCQWVKTCESGIHVHWLPVPYSNYMGFTRRLMAFFHFAFAATKKAAALQGDLVFATSTPLTIAIPAVFSSRKSHIPMVFEVRDLWPELPIAVGALRNPILQYLAKSLEVWAYKNAAAIVALSPGMKRGVSRAGYPASRIATIPNCSDNAFFECTEPQATPLDQVIPCLAETREAPLLVYTGTLGTINGVGYLVNLAVALNDIQSDVMILIAGEGAEKPAIVEQAKQKGILGKNLFIAPPIPKKHIPELLSYATMCAVLFVDIPEMRVNSANKFFDALAASKPVFLNFGGWMNDLVAAENCGLAMWNTPIADAARTLDSKLHDRRWLEAAGRASKQLARRQFDRDQSAAKLIKVLQVTVSGNADMAETIAPDTFHSTV